MEPTKMTGDSTIADIHRTRRAIAEKFDCDLAAIVEDARRRQSKSGRAIWQSPAAESAKDLPKDLKESSLVGDSNLMSAPDSTSAH